MINLNDIQSVEDMLCIETISYFLKHPERLFNCTPSIKVIESGHPKFKFYSLDGNNRLFVCYRLKILDLPLGFKPKNEYDDNLHLPIALKQYRKGLRRWCDLERKIYTRQEIDLGV